MSDFQKRFKRIILFLMITSCLFLLSCESIGLKMPHISKDMFKVKKQKAHQQEQEVVIKLDEPLKIEKVYKGYSKTYKPIKDLIYNAHFKEAIQAYHGSENKTEKSILPKINLESNSLKVLHNMELGILHLEVGDIKKCYNHIENCLKELDKKESKGIITSKVSSGLFSAASLISGNDELSPYHPVGYEKIMILNYKAIHYLLSGKRKAFNVAREAIDCQNIERDLFEKELKKIDIAQKNKEAEQKMKMNQQQTKNSSPSLASLKKEIEKIVKKLKKRLQDEYSQTHSLAMQSKSAYVNPFADYLTGMIMEYETYNDPNKADDAKRAYQKAYNLNPKSKLLKRALNDMKKKHKRSKNKRLLHVVVFDGFAPEKKVLKTTVPVPPDKLVTVQLPIMGQITSDVTSLKVLSENNNILATMDIIVNMESMVLRHQKDMESQIYMTATALIMKSFAAQEVGKRFGILGNIFVSKAVDEIANPETRSWTSIPSKIYAARLSLNNGIKKVKIASYDHNGRRLALKTLKISPKGHNFIYGRSVDKTLMAQTSQKLWVN